MQTSPRRVLARIALLGVASLVLGLPLPIAASSGQAVPASDETAAPAQLRATRAQEHAQRRAQRALQRAQKRADRAQERAQRRERREQARAQRSADREQATSESDSRPQQRRSATGLKGEANAAEEPDGATQAGSPGCQLSLTAAPQQVIVGASTTLTGRLTCADEAQAAGKPVSLYARGRSAARSKLGVETTAGDGSFELTSSALDVDTHFTASVAGSPSAHLLVKVAPQITLSGPASGQVSAASAFTRPRVSGKVRFTGATSPTLAGARVALQVSSVAPARPWHPVAFARIDATGHFVLVHRFKAPGETSVRATARSGRLTAPAISEALTYEVAQPQVSALTIHASADPLSYGQPVTITGVAAAAPSATVTLLAHNAASGFTPVAQATTDQLGHYSFTETPLENTYYEVTGPGATSTALFEGVAFVLAPSAQPADVHAGEQLSLTGTAMPALPGQLVYLERKSTAGDGFHVVARGTVSDVLSDYSISYAPTRSGPDVLRLRVAGDGDHETELGEPFTGTMTP